jgi:hypothetical protein
MSELAIIKSSTLTDIADAIRTKKGIESPVNIVDSQNVILPNGYKQREYIESSGTQYVDTGYKFTSNKIRIHMEIENLNTASGASLCGIESSVGYAAILYSYSSADVFTLHMGTTSHIVTIQLPADGAFHVVEIETFGDGTGRITVDGSVQNFTFDGNINGDLALYIGALNTESGATDFSKQRTKIFKIWDNDILVRDYITCTKSDDIAGLYDVANSKFHGNAGNGLFTAGPEVEPDSGDDSGSDSGSGDNTGAGTDEFYLIPTSSMASEILSISSGAELPTLNYPATSSHILDGYEAIDESGNKVTGSIPIADYQYIIPGTSVQTIPSGQYLSSIISVGGDTNLQSSNIKDGVTIFGVEGSYAGDGVDVSNSTLTSANQLLSPIKAYDKNGQLITGTIPTNTTDDLIISGRVFTAPAGYYASDSKATMELATKPKPVITVGADGKIDAYYNLDGGYYSAGIKYADTKQLTTKGETTITPRASNQTAVSSGVYTTGTITVEGDTNLQSSNIKSGVSIFGVPGGYTGESVKCETGSASLTVSSGFSFNLSNSFSNIYAIYIVSQSEETSTIDTISIFNGDGGTSCSEVIHGNFTYYNKYDEVTTEYFYSGKSKTVGFSYSNGKLSIDCDDFVNAYINAIDIPAEFDYVVIGS